MDYIGTEVISSVHVVCIFYRFASLSEALIL